MSSKSAISLSTLGGSSNNHGVGSEASESIQMSTNFNANKITILDFNGVLRQRRKVSADLVDREASGEGNTSFQFLTLFALANL